MRIHALILLYMCPHTTICVLIPLYMCPHATIYVLILLYARSFHHTTICVLMLLYASSRQEDPSICQYMPVRASMPFRARRTHLRLAICLSAYYCQLKASYTSNLRPHAYIPVRAITTHLRHVRRCGPASPIHSRCV